MESLQKLFEKKIAWKKCGVKNDEFIFSDNGKSFKLKMNDFPDEVMFTVSFENESIDIDDLPKKWKIEV